MGPLVPHIISNEFDLIVALMIGIAFGFVLEQAGFSSTKKLAGLFYGYDFTVLKVFFTAGVTAMLGVLLLGQAGLLDLSLIYVNPTFLWSALVGGAIMGAGFIIGGFCPGTSVCAASIGKIDAIVFILGSAGGVWFFSEYYSWFEHLYLAENWGPVLVTEILGISKPLFALLLTVVAFGAFYLTHLIENKVNKYPTAVTKLRARKYLLAEAAAFVALGVIAFVPSHADQVAREIAWAEAQPDYRYETIPADKLAFEIANNSGQINVIDVRTPEEFAAYHIPLAVNIPLDQLTNRQWELTFKQRVKTNYIYAGSDSIARRAYLTAGYLGKASNCLVTASADDFRALYSQTVALPESATHNEVLVLRYRNELITKMNRLVEALSKMNQPVKQKESKIKGGCS